MRLTHAAVLTSSLNDTCKENPIRPYSVVPDGTPTKTPQVTFRSFANSLAQVCDNERHGDTVTALFLEQRKQHVCYVLTSNRRGQAEAKKLESFVETLLKAVKCKLGGGVASDEGLQTTALNKIIPFNRARLAFHMRMFARNAEICIDIGEGSRMYFGRP